MSSKEELYKVLVESVPYGTLFFAYGVCVDANKHALELLGCRLDQMVGASLDNITGEESSALVDLKFQLKKATKNREKEIQWQCPLEDGSCDVTVNIVYVTEDDKELVVMLNHQQVASQPISSHQLDSQQVDSLQSPEEKLSSQSTNFVPPAPSNPSLSTDKLPSIFPKSYSADSVPSFIDTPFVGASDKAADPELENYGQEQDGFEPIERNSRPGPEKVVAQKPESELKDFHSFTNPVPGSELANAIKPGISSDFMAQSESGVLQELEEDTESIKPWDKASRDYYFDGLTNLPNRQMLSQTISSFLEGHKNQQVCGAVMMLDLDHFKDINDSWGHTVGDQVIKKIGRAVTSLVTGENMLARMSGDEFVLFIPELSDSISQAAWDAQAVAEKVGEIVATPIFQDGHEIILTASIGISLVTDSNVTAEHVLQYADTAMYEAKRKGRNSIAFFDPCITEKAQRQIGMNTRLRKALDNHEFALYVQPQICVQSGGMLGGEVLLRWMSSEKVTNMPSEFIPVLESSGLIVDVGRWVIRTACEYVRTFLDKGIWQDHMRLSINISPRQFRDPQLLEIVQHSMSSYNIDPKYLNFEVTENLVIDDVDEAIEKMEAIKSLGAMFSIDDFGIGYSSMIYLKRLPFDQLKIDREFIRNIHRDPESRGVVEAIMAVSKQYGLKVTAEGVEDREALTILKELGCHSYQGAHFSMPVPCDHFTKLLAA
jgi:diguanylate cyclase (GGDEF)-like protein/PAS domain S-box-containing protein